MSLSRCQDERLARLPTYADWAPTGFFRTLRRLVSQASAMLLLWQQRATLRNCLAQLDDRLLRDIGMTRWEAEREAAKPFWRA